MELIDIFMAVPLVLVPLGLVLTFIYGVYQEYKTTGVVMLILFSWFFAGLLYHIKPAHSASARLDISATILNWSTLPIDEAIAECDKYNHPCPAIRSKADPIIQFTNELNPDDADMVKDFLLREAIKQANEIGKTTVIQFSSAEGNNQ